MALRNFNFDVSINGIIPNIVTDAGTQGDHGVTRLNFMLTEEIYQEIVDSVVDGRVVYRFDLYNGEGGIWQSEALSLVSRDVGITLEEKHTRFGGKLIVYLIITALSSNNKTEIELYNYPIMLKLKNRPNGVFQEGENYQSVASLAENVKQQVLLAAGFAETTKEYNEQAREFAALVEEKLKNGEFDGVGVEKAEIVDGELIITYSNGNSQNLGNIIGWEDDGSGTAVPTVLYPMSESDALNNSTPYKFVLTNTGDYDLLLTIKLEPDTSFDLVNEWPSYSDYSSDYANINIAFGEDNLTPTSMAYSSLTNYEIADNIVLEAGDSKIYNLYAWVDENAENSAQGTYFVTAISVVGEYIPES